MIQDFRAVFDVRKNPRLRNASIAELRVLHQKAFSLSGVSVMEYLNLEQVMPE